MRKEPIPKWDPRYDKLDKVVLTAADLERLYEWAEARDLFNKPLGLGFDISFPEAVIEIQTTVKGLVNLLHYEVVNQDGVQGVMFKFYFKQLLALGFMWFDDDKEIKILGYAQSDDWTAPPKDYADHWFQTFVILMIYMMEYREDVERVRRETTSVPNPKKKTHKGAKRSIKIGRHYINVPQTSHSSEPRPFERKVDSWRVKGHWRYYKKSDKKVWVASHIKGDKTKEPEGKVYKL